MPVIVTLAFLFWKEADIDWGNGLLAIVGMILFHLAGNTWSDYFDYRKGIDTQETFEPKALTTGGFRLKEVILLAVGLLAAACACGIYLLAVTGLPLLWIGLAGVILTVAIPVGLFAVGILHANNTRDMVSDRDSGIRTFAMQCGSRGAARVYAVELIFPYIWVGTLSVIGILPMHTVLILRSSRITFTPVLAALTAAATPAGPPPSTTTSASATTGISLAGAFSHPMSFKKNLSLSTHHAFDYLCCHLLIIFVRGHTKQSIFI